MATTEQTQDDSTEQKDPNTLLGVALGFAGIVLIAKEKLFLGALSLVGGALIGLQSHQNQQQQGAKTSSPESAPDTARQSTEKQSTAKQDSARATRSAAKKQAASKPASKKAAPKKAKAKAAPQAKQTQPTATKATPKKAKATEPATASKTGSSKKAAPENSSAPKPAATKLASKSTAKGELHQIEGIGPKIAEVLGAAGIQSFAQLAQTTPDQLRGILAEAGSRFSFADPTTWPEQAALAAAGQWDDLSTLKGQLKGGRRSG